MAGLSAGKEVRVVVYNGPSSSVLNTLYLTYNDAWRKNIPVSLTGTPYYLQVANIVTELNPSSPGESAPVMLTLTLEGTVI